jgi:preprotein translocase subunit SecE
MAITDKKNVMAADSGARPRVPTGEPRAPRTGSGSLWSELFQVGVYKRSQGRIARQITFFTLVVTFVIVCWRFSVLISPAWLLGLFGVANVSEAAAGAVRLGIPAVLLALGVWFSFRLVNVPRFADFLIAVEAEMNKVSWPTRSELFRSSIVVIVVLVLLSAVLFLYDIIWRFLFQWLGILG